MSIARPLPPAAPPRISLLHLPSSIRARARHLQPVGRAHISRQRQFALWLTVFAAIRTLAWVLCMLVIGIHWLGAGGSFIQAFIRVSSTVLFVTFISFYCNASTDAANFIAGVAALFSADSHHDAEQARREIAVDFGTLESDILRLAELEPCDEARQLAASIQARLRGQAR